MANFPEKTDSCPGTCAKYGAPDVRRFARLYNNQNVNIACYSNSTVCVNEGNVWEWQSDSCGKTAEYFQAKGSCNNYRIVTCTLAANREIKIPTLTGNDTFTFNSATATLTNKTINIACNTLSDSCAANGEMLVYNSVCAVYEPQRVKETFLIRFGNNCTAVSTGNGQYEFQMPYCFTLTEVFATVKTASTSGTPTIQIQQNGLDILSTEITIDANEKTSRTAVTAPVIADNTMDIDGVITFDVDVAGTGTAGLVVYLIGYQRF